MDGAAIPVITVPLLASIFGLLLIYAGAVRLRGLRTAAPRERIAGVAYGLIGLVTGSAILIYAASVYFR